jgi:hypothetical protein
VSIPIEASVAMVQPARVELAKVLAHKLFRKSEVLRRLFTYLLDAALREQPVTDKILARELLGLAEDEFHPYTNSYVRVNVSSGTPS